MLKKYIAGLFLSGIFALPAFAATNDEILARLESLERSLKEVKSENAALKRKLRTEPAIVSATPATPVRSSPSDAMAMVQPYAKAPVTTYDWSGLYVGVQGGGASVMPRAGVYSANNPRTFQTFDRTIFGAVGGYAGANLQFGTLVFGIDGQWTYYPGAEISGPLDPNTMASSFREAVTVRARLGFALDGDLLYFAGGPSWAKSQFRVFSPLGQVLSTGNHAIGYSIAGGWEHRFDPNWVMRAQIQYSDYEAQKFTTNSGTTLGHQISLIEATLGLSYKFNPVY